jgi:hypothetical protein
MIAAIGRCLTFWPQIEESMARLLGVLLGAKTEATVAVYLTLSAGRARQNAMVAAGTEILDEPSFELLQAILLVHRSAEKQRNDLAHGSYGTHAKIPDGVLWIESKHSAKWHLSVWQKDEAQSRTGKEHAELAKLMFVYTKTDVEKIYEEMMSVWDILFQFTNYLRQMDSSRHPSRDELYRQLCSEPRIRQALLQVGARKSKP